jgi:predicted ribosomally synthesized peptide with SipW-like signal peptide
MGIKKTMAMAMATTALGAMLVAGGTFAVFTSSAQNTGNTFTAGTVNISLDKPNGAYYFDITNIAPGDMGSSTVTVTNNGSLDLRYDLAESLTGALAGANGLQATVKDSNGVVITPGDTNRVLAASMSEVLTVEWTLPIAAGNEFQGQSAQLGLTVNAEQTKNN